MAKQWMTGLLAAGVLTMVAGCRVETHKDAEHNDVKIATPFGGMSVKTDEATVRDGVGLTAYPGATLVTKPNHDGDKDDSNAADVNLSFGGFHLGVKAVSYRTPDAPDKVLDFYRKDMAKFGTVILCRGEQPVGTPARTPDGLSCDKDSEGGGHHIHVDDDHGSVGELKAGSKQHQHLVAIDREGSGTKFGLIMLDLPGHLGGGEDKQ